MDSLRLAVATVLKAQQDTYSFNIHSNLFNFMYANGNIKLYIAYKINRFSDRFLSTDMQSNIPDVQLITATCITTSGKYAYLLQLLESLIGVCIISIIANKKCYRTNGYICKYAIMTRIDLHVELYVHR